MPLNSHVARAKEPGTTRWWTNPVGWGMFAAGALVAGSFVWLTMQPLRDEVHIRNLEVAALKSRLESYGLNERRISAQAHDVQRLNRALAATESALQQANQREEALRRRVASLTGGKPELMGPPAPLKSPRAASILRPDVLSAVRSSDDQPSRPLTGGNRLLSPVGTYLREDRPGFTWKPVEDAVTYDLVIYTAQGQEVAREVGIPEPRRTLARSLSRGKIYRWEVFAFGGGRQLAQVPGPNEPPALFGIFSREQLQLGERIEAESRLTRAAGLAKAGLLDEAEGEIASILQTAADPGLRRRAETLRGQIKSWQQ